MLEDIIEIGVYVLNPLEVSATAMYRPRPRGRLSDGLSLCGDIETQRVLRRCTMGEVWKEMRRAIQELAPDVGYLLAALHSIQPDKLPENVCGIFEAALSCGRCPVT